MNNFEKYDQLNNDDNYINGIGELNIEALNTVDNKEPCKWSVDNLLADSVKNTRNTNEALDWEDSYESHYYPNEDLFSNSGFDFERWDD